MRRIITVVFEVMADELSDPLWDALKTNGEVLGMRPFIISNGDAVTIPGRVTELAAQMDSGTSGCEVDELAEMAQKYTRRDML